LGLKAEKSGRNDVLVEGRKVSGNAFQQLPSRSIVHGTLLYDTDLTALEKSIRPPVEKLERHGIASVRQRVANLKKCLEDPDAASIEALEKYLVDWFCDGEINLAEKDVHEIEAGAACFEQFE
jgi:lipoate-protein ligase A